MISALVPVLPCSPPLTARETVDQMVYVIHPQPTQPLTNNTDPARGRLVWEFQLAFPRDSQSRWSGLCSSVLEPRLRSNGTPEKHHPLGCRIGNRLRRST